MSMVTPQGGSVSMRTRSTHSPASRRNFTSQIRHPASCANGAAAAVTSAVISFAFIVSDHPVLKNCAFNKKERETRSNQTNRSSKNGQKSRSRQSIPTNRSGRLFTEKSEPPNQSGRFPGGSRFAYALTSSIISHSGRLCKPFPIFFAGKNAGMRSRCAHSGRFPGGCFFPGAPGI